MQDTIDPDGIDTRTLYDALGRTTTTIQNFVCGGADTADQNVKTTYAYNGDNDVTLVTAYQADGQFEQTEYDYGVTTQAGTGPGQGSDINSDDLLAAVFYADPESGVAGTLEDGTGQSLVQTFTYDAQGDQTSMTDQNGTTHDYTYDVLGRMTSDQVTALGTNVDGTVMQITYAYDAQGNQYLTTCLGESGNIVNQVMDVYNGLGQLTGEYQSVTGAVNTVTTPEVQYTYTEMMGGNNSRLTSMVYPDGYTVYYNYGSPGSLTDRISQLSSISDDTGTLESYVYQGVSTVVERDHPQDGVNAVTTLDQFGNVQELNWTNGTTSTADYQYTYDNDGNVLARQDAVNGNFSQTYSYNKLGELTGYSEGPLVGTTRSWIRQRASRTRWTRWATSPA